MGAAGSNSIANATGYPVFIAYSTDKMRTIQGTTTESANASCGYQQGFSGNINLTSSSEMAQSHDDRVRKITIPVQDFTPFSGEGTIYASVYVQVCDCCPQNMKMVFENFHVPDGRSFIVTANHNIKFVKDGEEAWIDEDDNDHWCGE